MRKMNVLQDNVKIMMRNVVRIVMRRVEEQMNVLQEGISENNDEYFLETWPTCK